MEQKHGFIIFDFHSNGDSNGCNWVWGETRKSFTDSVVDFESVPKNNPTPLLCVLFHSSWSRYRAKKCQPQTARVFRIATLETSRSWTTMLPTLVLVAVCICWGCYSELPQTERTETLLVHYLTVVAVRNLKSVSKDSTEQACLEAQGTKYAAFILLSSSAVLSSVGFLQPLHSRLFLSTHHFYHSLPLPASLLLEIAFSVHPDNSKQPCPSPFLVSFCHEVINPLSTGEDMDIWKVCYSAYHSDSSLMPIKTMWHGYHASCVNLDIFPFRY